LLDRIATVRAELAAAALAAGRDPADITLIAVSKTFPAEAIGDAYAAGLRHFGENYVQEACDKIDQLRDLDGAVWHFIGPLQSNKSRMVAERFDWVHSVDRESIARRLSDQRPPHLPPLKVCIQVNVSGEDSKSGVSPDTLPALVDTVAALPRLELRGLMAIPAPCDDPALQRAPFARLRALRDAQFARPDGHPAQPLGEAVESTALRAEVAASTHPPAAFGASGRAWTGDLSMGMSADYAAAIAEGATLVRIGSAIFGARPARAATAGD